MELVEVLPSLLATLNGVNVTLLITAFAAIRRGNRGRHRALMLTNLGVGVLFIVVYVTEVSLV